MRRPTVLGMGLAWLAVVAVVSAVTWAVIDAAGRDVLTAGDPGSLPSTGLTAAAVPSGASGTPSASPGRSSRPARPTTRSSGTPAATSTRPAPTPEPSTPQHPPAQPSTQPPAEQPAPQPGGQPQAQVRSWQGPAGTVVVRCVGPRASLQSVTPADGWGVEVERRGPEEVEVELKTRGEDERKTQVQAECAGGVPRFRVESED